MTLEPGAVVADRRLDSRLGQGGEGEVWLAQRPDGSVCALKLIRPTVLPPPEEVRRRGRWLVHINHPALVRVTRGGRFTSGLLSGWGFVEMDVVEGPSLQEAPPLPRALDLLAPVAEALDLLHAGAWSDGVPLIHRDVKPGNLIGATTGLVLVDPSTMRGLDTTDLTRVGTPAYLAPEVATGRFGPLADVYSLAATAVALLTGSRGRDLLEVLAHPGEHDLPPSVIAALDHDPARRPGTCSSVVADISPLEVGPAVVNDRAQTIRGPSGGPRWAIPMLAVVIGLPAVAWALAPGTPVRIGPLSVAQVVSAAAGATHLLVHALTRNLSTGLFAPPWAWGRLIATQTHGARSASPHGAGEYSPAARQGRRRWLADVVAGLLVVASLVALLVALGTLARPAARLLGTARAAYPLIAVAVVALVALASRTAATGSRVGWAILWPLWLPVRLIGAIPRIVVTGGRG